MDDASPDFNLTELLGPPFNVARAEFNEGYVKTCNTGAKLSAGEFIFFMNSDLELRPNWLDPAVKLFDNPKVGVVGIKLVFPPDEKGQVNIQSAGGYYDAGKMPFHRYLGWREDAPQVNKTEKVSWVTGAAIITRRSLFEQIGGFDEGYGRGYFEDPAYCESVKKLGYEIWYSHESSAVHFVGQSMKTKTDGHQAALSFYRNARKFARDWEITPDVPYIAVQY